MDLVSFTFLGQKTKIEVMHTHTSIITQLHNNVFLAGLINSEPTIFEANDKRVTAVYEWCKIHADFKDKFKNNVTNFVFNTEG